MIKDKVKNYIILISTSLLIITLLLLYNSHSNNSTLEERSEYFRNNSTLLDKEVARLKREVDRKTSEISQLNRTVTTVETRPDGTTIKKVEKSEKKTKVFERETDKSVVSREKVSAQEEESVGERREKIEREVLSRYSVSVFQSFPKNHYNIGVGVRVGDLPIFIEGQVSTELTIMGGLRWEW